MSKNEHADLIDWLKQWAEKLDSVQQDFDSTQPDLGKAENPELTAIVSMVRREVREAAEAAAAASAYARTR